MTFWKDVIERAVKTAAQTAIGIIGASTLITAVDWKVVLSSVTMATLLSMLSSIASRGVTHCDSASLLAVPKEEGK